MITIRRIRVGEARLFSELRLAALQESPSAFLTTYASARQRSPESWSEQANSTAEGRDRATFFAFSDGLAVGIAAIYRDDENAQEGELLQVWVAPEFRGSRVARALLNTALRWSAENGFRRVWARVTPGNARALAFYKKCGFVAVDASARDPLGNEVLVREMTGSE